MAENMKAMINFAVDLTEEFVRSKINYDNYISADSVKAILDNTPINTTRDEVFRVINIKDAFYFILEQLTFYNNCLAFVSKLHRIISHGFVDNHGRVRTTDIKFNNITLPAPHEAHLAERMRQINCIDDRVDCALEHFCFMCYMHPFNTNNLQIAQLLASKVLLESKIGLLFVSDSKRTEFFKLLDNYLRYGNNKDEFKNFLKQQCIVYY